MSGKNLRLNRTRVIAAAAAVAVLPVALTGCWNGFGAQTAVQPPSGDGLNTQVGMIQIRNVVWVRSKDNPTVLTLSATFVNTGKTADALTAVTTNPASGAVGLTNGSIELEPISETRTAFNSDEYVNAIGVTQVPPSGYLQTTFIFKEAGKVTGSVMTVPSEGIYEDINPSIGGKASPSRVPSPRATASKSGTASPTVSPTAS